MERSIIRGKTLGSYCVERGIPDYAALHPGYGPYGYAFHSALNCVATTSA
jgi:hypothetical protein